MPERKRNIKISYCLPVYNVKDYIAECIDSIYTQGISDFEIICVDDCSTDGSFEEVQRLAKAHDEMVVLRNETNRGICYSRNRAINEAVGEYIWFVDSDDILVPHSTRLYYDVAQKTEADAVFGRCITFQESTRNMPMKNGAGSYKVVDFSDPDQ